MESDHKSNYKNGTPVNRNGVRGARPRLADLLESVTVPDEGDVAGLPYANGADRAELGDSNSPSSKSFGSSSATSTTESSRLPDESPLASDFATTIEPSKFDTAAFGDDSVEEYLSPAALAAKERREALYSLRENESNSVRNGHTSREKSEVKSFAERLYGERQSSEHEPNAQGSGSFLGQTDSSVDSVSNGSSTTSSLPGSSSFQSLDGQINSDSSGDDWTRKFSADAPLPTSSDFPARSSRVDHVPETLVPEALVPETNGFRSAAEYVSGKDASDFSHLDKPLVDKPLTERFSSEQSDSERPLSNRSHSDGSIASSSHPSSSHSNNENIETSSLLERSQANPQPTTRRYDTTGPSSAELLNSVSIKGRSDGVSIEVGQGKWSDVLDALSQRLVQSTGFFRGGKVTLDVGVRPLQESELREVSALTEQHGLSLTSIRSRSEQSCQVALAAGLAASLDAPDGLLAQPALSNYEKLEHFVYRGNLRSGQILRRAETILVMGDVNPGSQIISDSDILIWGRLRGIAHAGASGDQKAVIAALLMEPTQIRISDAIAILPEQEVKISITERLSGGNASPNGVKRPEIAHAIGADIIVDMWDESKPGGIMAFRRSL